MLWVLDIHPGSSLKAVAPGMTPSPWSYKYCCRNPPRRLLQTQALSSGEACVLIMGWGVGGEGTWGWHTVIPLQLVRFLYLLAVLAGEGEVECLKYLG